MFCFDAQFPPEDKLNGMPLLSVDDIKNGMVPNLCFNMLKVWMSVVSSNWIIIWPVLGSRENDSEVIGTNWLFAGIRSNLNIWLVTSARQLPELHNVGNKA
jgi:hypothetical protein